MNPTRKERKAIREKNRLRLLDRLCRSFGSGRRPPSRR